MKTRTAESVLARLQALGVESIRARHIRDGAGDDVYGVKMGDIRGLAKEIKSDHELGMALWQTGNLDGRLLATLIVKPKQLSIKELEAMTADVTLAWLADWLMTHILRNHPKKEDLRLEWMESHHPAKLRAGWSLTTERVSKSPEGLDISALLNRIEKEMSLEHDLPKWTMNYCLAEIGINFPEHRARALSIGEKLGVYRDYPVSKGCTSPFAPCWINEMVNRKNRSS